jgi:hypothetical protein
MHAWEYLLAAAAEHSIDSDRKAAYNWLASVVPGAFGRVSGDLVPHFDLYSQEKWEEWQDRFEALRWLAAKRARTVKPRGDADRIRMDIQTVVSNVLNGVKIGPRSHFLSDGVGVVRSPEFIQHGRPGNIDEMWQIAFLSYFWPELLGIAGLCDECGRVITKTTKSGKPSKDRFCSPSCRMKCWRREKPDKAREYDREYKRSQRKEMREQSERLNKKSRR